MTLVVVLGLAPGGIVAAWGQATAPADGASTPLPEPAATQGAVPTADEIGPLGDPYLPQQWQLERIGVTDELPATGSGVVIAVIDSGVDLDHPDLADALLRDDAGQIVGRDWVDDDDDPSDVLGHGTMVAGVAVARAGNGVGTRGVAPGAQVMPLRVLDSQGMGDTTDIAQAIEFAVDNGADIINLSLEAASATQVGDVDVVAQAIRRAVTDGVVVVAAAGNTQDELTDFAPELGVLVVGATDRDDRRAGFSADGREDLIMAPGVGIVSSWCRSGEQPACDGETHSQGVADGTSFAAPAVSGVAALLLEAQVPPDQVVARLRQTARDLGRSGPDPMTGVGMVDAAAALALWPAVPIAPVTPQEVPDVAVDLPQQATPQPIMVAAAPTATRAVLWLTIAIVVAVVLAVGGGLVAQRRIHPLGTMPDLRG